MAQQLLSGNEDRIREHLRKVLHTFRQQLAESNDRRSTRHGHEGPAEMDDDLKLLGTG
jgi:hypothetical protein